jgi:hypothetical protein
MWIAASDPSADLHEGILAMHLKSSYGLQQAYPGLTTGPTPDFIKSGLEDTCVWSPQ